MDIEVRLNIAGLCSDSTGLRRGRGRTHVGRALAGPQRGSESEHRKDPHGYQWEKRVRPEARSH